MTFQVSLDEWMEGHYLYARSQNRLLRFTPFFFGFLILVLGFGFWMKPSWMGGLFWVLIVASVLHTWLWEPYNLRRKFRRDCKGDVTPPISYEFSHEGFIWRSTQGERQILWSHIKKRIEGRNVWLFVVQGKKTFFLVLPKRATDSPQGQAEWSVVDAAFAPLPSPPIARP